MLRYAGVVVAVALAAPGQSFNSPFKGYVFSPVYENATHPTPYVPLSFGGVLVDRGNPNSILLGGNVAGAGGAFYSVPVGRDYTGNIAGLVSPGTQAIAAPRLGSGLAYGPPQQPGALLYSIESGSGGIDAGYVKAGAAGASQTFSLVPESSSTLQFVPSFIGPDAGGQLKLLTRSGRFYEIPYTADANSFTPGTPSLVATLPVSNVAGLAYVHRGSAGFTTDALLVAEVGGDRIVAYNIDGNGNPLAASRRVFLTGLRGISGMTVDPLTSDLIVSTRMNSTSGIYRIDGFSAGPPTVLSQCSTNITGSGVFTLPGNLANTQTCLSFTNNVNVTLDCGGNTISGGVLFNGVRVFRIRNCNLRHSGIHSVLTLIDSHYGEIVNNTIGDPGSSERTQISMSDMLRVRVWENTIAVGWLVFEKSREIWLRKNNITCTPDCVYLVESRQGVMNAFDANVLDGRNVASYGFLMRDESNSYVEGNTIGRFTVDGIALLGTNVFVNVYGNTVN